MHIVGVEHRPALGEVVPRVGEKFSQAETLRGILGTSSLLGRIPALRAPKADPFRRKIPPWERIAFLDKDGLRRLRR